MRFYILFTVLVYCLYACKGPAKQVAEAEKPIGDTISLTAEQVKFSGIQYGKVTLMPVGAVLQVNGILDVPPKNLVTVSAIMGGYVRSTELLQGQRVHKGHILVTLENLDIIQIQKDYLDNLGRMKFLEAEFERQKELSTENVSAVKTFQQVTADFTGTKANHAALTERLKLLGISTKSVEAGHITSTIEVRSPIDGFITVVNVNRGRYISPQDIICEIVDNGHLHAELTVFEKDIPLVNVGQKIRVMIANEPGKERLASVYLINKKISDDRTVRVHAHFDEEDFGLLPNQYLKALIELGDSVCTAVPNAALVSAGEKYYLFIKAGNEESGENKFKAIEVVKKQSENGFTGVVLPDGFDIKGEEIVVKGAYQLLSKRNNTEEE